MLNDNAFIAAELIAGASDTGVDTQDCRVLPPLVFGNVYVVDVLLFGRNKIFQKRFRNTIFIPRNNVYSLTMFHILNKR